MNDGHMAFCASDEWRTMVQETILPVALRGVVLGGEVLEIGPGPGFTTDVLRTMTAHLTIDPEELECRLGTAGFGSIEVRTFDLGWVCTARAG